MFSIGGIDKNIKVAFIVGTEATESIFTIFGKSEIDRYGLEGAGWRGIKKTVGNREEDQDEDL